MEETHKRSKTEDNSAGLCPCKCGHILPESHAPKGIIQMIIPGGTQYEYYTFIHKPGALCYNCHHAGCISSDIIVPPLFPNIKI